MLDSVKTIQCVFVPPTSTKPARYSVRCAGYRPVLIAPGVECVDGLSEALHCADEFIRRNSLQWVITGAGQLANSDRVFLAGPRPAFEELPFHRVASDQNGNPRFVVDYSYFLRADEIGKCVPLEVAFARARSIGGRKYTGKQYRGGIVFDTYCRAETAAEISRLTGRKFKAQE